MNKLLETYYPPKLSQEEEESLNRLIPAGEMGAVIKKWYHPRHERPGSDGLTGECYKKFKEALILILLKLFQKIQGERRLPNYFHEASTIIIPKPVKGTKQKEIYRAISLMIINAKIHNKCWQTSSSHTLKRSYTMIKWDSSQRSRDGIIYTNQ